MFNLTAQIVIPRIPCSTMRAELTYLVEQYRAIREALNENKNNLPEEEIWDLFASQETRIIAVLIEANQYRAHDFLE